MVFVIHITLLSHPHITNVSVCLVLKCCWPADSFCQTPQSYLHTTQTLPYTPKCLALASCSTPFGPPTASTTAPPKLSFAPPTPQRKSSSTTALPPISSRSGQEAWTLLSSTPSAGLTSSETRGPSQRAPRNQPHCWLTPNLDAAAISTKASTSGSRLPPQKQSCCTSAAFRGKRTCACSSRPTAP